MYVPCNPTVEQTQNIFMQIDYGRVKNAIETRLKSF